MPPFDLVVRGGTVVTAADQFDADIGVRDGRIVALGSRLDAGAQEIDAAGRLVLPGGVDTHVHLEQRSSSSGQMTADDWLTGTRSAACGGTTTVVAFAAQQKGLPLRAAVEAYHACAGPKASIDYAFHLIVTDPTESVLGQELPALIKDGYSSFKIYTTYEAMKLDDRQILSVLAVARRHGAMVMIHAESHDAIAWLTTRLLDAGLTRPRFHAEARPPAAEREATHRAIALAEIVDQPILLVHVSAGEAFDQIRWAQGRGLKVFAETCPQYLFLSAEDLARDDLEGAKYCCSPPPRPRANQPAVWRALQTGVAQVFSSDHAPYRFDGPAGKAAGAARGFNRIANGVPGLELRLPLLFSEGVRRGRLSLQQFVALTATTPARLYNLPGKGSIAIGADADLVLWDPDREVTVTHGLLHDAMDYTPYEGMTLTGWPMVTLSRGQVVARDMAFVGTPGAGRFLARAASGLARPAAAP